MCNDFRNGINDMNDANKMNDINDTRSWLYFFQNLIQGKFVKTKYYGN